MKCGDVNLTEAEYLTIIEKKTAVLISAACACGAILGGASAEKIDALKQFGYKIGMAFQITDDTLDYMAREQEFGKSIGKDLEEGKMTLPLIYALQKCKKKESAEAKKLLTDKDDSKKLTEVAMDLIHKYKGVDYSLRAASRYISEARSQLSIFSDCPEKDQLNAVAEYVLTRQL